jgi:hypothetical protein
MTVKDSGLRIRVQQELRDRFIEVCRAQDRPAAQVLRELMRTYIDRHTANAEGDPQATKQKKRALPHDH